MFLNRRFFHSTSVRVERESETRFGSGVGCHASRNPLCCSDISKASCRLSSSRPPKPKEFIPRTNEAGRSPTPMKSANLQTLARCYLASTFGTSMSLCSQNLQECPFLTCHTEKNTNWNSINFLQGKRLEALATEHFHTIYLTHITCLPDHLLPHCPVLSRPGLGWIMNPARPTTEWRIHKICISHRL